MRSNGLAMLAVALGTGLLGTSAAGVTALADDLPARTGTPAASECHGGGQLHGHRDQERDF